MAYGRQYNNYNNQQGSYQRSNYGGNNNYSQQPQPQPLPSVTPEQFIDDRIAIHQVFVNRIKEQGLDPADYTLFLGAWVTSFILENKRGMKN